MIQVYRYDENYIFIEPVIVEVDGNGSYVIPEYCTEIQPPSFYKAKFDIKKQEWFESATQEYINSLQPPPPEPSEVDVLAEKVANLYYIVAMGG
ncbi:hypothetical protein P8860_21670 [Bacillus spizizenii]|uniref:Uncharacterized protein n=1 Tax=Bacillus spizizenii TaxID=96241 RepID=A0A9Q4DSE6_BACSC|nr:hypothetical protein [Bacillus spizizenii]MEC0581903.1 hypothetical protein [Bacillus spizizenii]MEC0631866.1 hypothetical protein [Bacillus spizizenii]